MINILGLMMEAGSKNGTVVLNTTANIGAAVRYTHWFTFPANPSAYR